MSRQSNSCSVSSDELWPKLKRLVSQVSHFFHDSTHRLSNYRLTQFIVIDFFQQAPALIRFVRVILYLFIDTR